MADPETVICHYRLRPGAEAEFTDLLRRHWPTLRELELATDTPQRCYVGREREVEGTVMIEIFEWASLDAARRAHVHPKVSEIWERMGALCEDRGGRNAMEFPHFQPLELA